MSTTDPANAPAPASMGHKMLVSFGLFAVFFVFYVGAALVQSPAGKDVATIQVGGLPLGLILSLAVFPLSWLLIAIWFKVAR